MKKEIELSLGGKIEIKSKHKVTEKNLFQVYTPGMGEVVKEVANDLKKTDTLTWRGKLVAVVSDGSAILGLGNLGAEPALPVMEAKAVLFKEIGGINAVPIVLKTQDPKKIIEIVENIAPSFGGINLEDISAPNCFVVEETLKRKLNIPVFHDDQHGTAIVILAGLINAMKVVKKKLSTARIVISGAGAAGLATVKLLRKYGCRNFVIFDSKGAICKGRCGLNFEKKKIAQVTNGEKFQGSMETALKGADIFIGLSRANLLKAKDIEVMAKDSVVFALANPIPEIMPEEARKGGAKIIATGRGDFPNQINNALVFPGIFKGAFETDTRNINDEIKLKTAKAIAGILKKPTAGNIIPKVLDKRVSKAIVGAFK